MKRFYTVLVSFLAIPAFAFTTLMQEKDRIIDMLTPLGNYLNALAAENQNHYDTVGYCSGIGVSGGQVQSILDATAGALSGNLVSYIWSDSNDCQIYVAFNPVSSASSGAGTAYQKRLDKVFLVFTALMNNKNNADPLEAFVNATHYDAEETYEISDWKCRMEKWQAVSLGTGLITLAATGQDINLLSATTASDGTPFSFVKTIDGSETVINFSTELPGNLLKKCASFDLTPDI